MGIKKYAVEPTKTIHLKDANDNPMYADGADGEPDTSRPITATIYGPGSRQHANAQTKRATLVMHRFKTKGKTDLSTDERIKEDAEFLADCTQELTNVGEDYPGLSGRALAVAIYSDLEIGFVKDQIDAEMKEWGNFSKASANS